MVKLVTPTPDFFIQAGLDDMGPSYVANMTQKHNRPWLLFSLSETDSIMIPNRSGAMHENYEDYLVRTPTKSGHLAQSGFDIPHALIVHKREHELLNDWEMLNPSKHARAQELKNASNEVKTKTKDFINDFSKFSQETTNAQYADELPMPWVDSNKFRTLSSAGIQFKQEYIPPKFTYYNQKLNSLPTLDEYPMDIKRRFSKNVVFNDPEYNEPIETKFTKVTPLEALTYDVLESQNSPQQNVLLDNINANISNKYQSMSDYLERGPIQIQEQWNYDKLAYDDNTNNKDNALIVESSKKNKFPKAQAITKDDNLEL